MAFQKITEQNSLHDNLDKKSVHDLLIEMNEEDMKVPLAVSRALPQIEELVEKIVERMKRGGRIFYLGAGTSGRLGVLDASEILYAHSRTVLNAGGKRRAGGRRGSCRTKHSRGGKRTDRFAES